MTRAQFHVWNKKKKKKGREFCRWLFSGLILSKDKNKVWQDTTWLSQRYRIMPYNLYILCIRIKYSRYIS